LSGPVAETLVRDLVTQVRHTQQAESRMRDLLGDAYAALPASPHLQVVTIPGIGVATAATLVAQAVDIHRFSTPQRFVGYFGVFPEEDTSGVDKYGQPLPAGTLRMSRKGNDLVRHYLWNAARAAIVHNPVVRVLYQRLRAKGKRGDVALGQCMRKLLHLVYAVWQTDRPFDEQHAVGQPSNATSTSAALADAPAAILQSPASGVEPVSPPSSSNDAAPTHAVSSTPTAVNETAVGHKPDVPAEKVVTTASATVVPTPAPVKPSNRSARPKVDFTFLREQVSLEQVLSHLGLLEGLRGRGHQRRGPCPIHGQAGDTQPTFSAHLGKHLFQCFQADCRAQGNVLDLWAALHHLPLYEAALHLAATFHLPRNREEEPVPSTR
jgi:hypothetical protein